MTQEIKLPPLPAELYGCGDIAREWGRSAVEADRRERGEPIGFLVPTKPGRQPTFVPRDRAALNADTAYGWQPVYSTPHPAEPVKVPSDEEIIALSREKLATARTDNMVAFARALLSRYGQSWQELAAAMYQAAGAYDMPVRVLDALSAAANGEPFAHLIGGLLPVEAPVAAQAQPTMPPGKIQPTDQLRRAAQELADWAEHEVGAEPSLTPGLTAVRAALAQAQPAVNQSTEREVLEEIADWMDSQADAQSKGGHATFDIMMLREMRDKARAALAQQPNGQDREDAERWRYVRRKMCFTGNGNGTCAMQAINLPANIPGWPDIGGVEEFCDAAIDAARAAKERT